jgi:hypothetical protein
VALQPVERTQNLQISLLPLLNIQIWLPIQVLGSSTRFAETKRIRFVICVHFADRTSTGLADFVLGAAFANASGAIFDRVSTTIQAHAVHDCCREEVGHEKWWEFADRVLMLRVQVRGNVWRDRPLYYMLGTSHGVQAMACSSELCFQSLSF